MRPPCSLGLARLDFMVSLAELRSARPRTRLGLPQLSLGLGLARVLFGFSHLPKALVLGSARQQVFVGLAGFSLVPTADACELGL